MKKKLLFCLALALATTLQANNISLSNLQLTGQNTTSDYILLQFDISWENSWRTSSAPFNWDAAWVFIKYRVPVANGGDGIWKHAWLNDAGHTAPAGSAIEIGLLTPGTAFNSTTNPGLGAFIYRDADGTGTFSETGVQLRWNYGANGVADDAVLEFTVYGIEMVYVPQGAFYAGSGGTETGSFTDGSWTSGATVPLSISSENALTVAHSAGNLWYTAGGNSGDQAGPIPAAFPKGYNSFYCMKYEISQQGYVDFLNSLTQTQATNRKHTYAGERYAITGSAVGSYATTNPYLACNYLNWADVGAYLDWSGLRPMTELEFEKACRGTASPVANEYAWGTAGVAGSLYTLSNSGTNNEEIATNYSTSDGNSLYAATNGIGGPVRVGIFAGTGGNTGRVTAGATYYGIMEMNGNLWERPVTVGNASGRAFTGAHGNGALAADGNIDAPYWPGYDAIGAGLRGCSYNNDASSLRLSDRYLATIPHNNRYYAFGGRGVRTTTVVPVFLPTVTTASLSIITSTSAVCGGNVTSDGGSPVTARGVCWRTEPYPTIADSHTTNGGGTGEFVCGLTGLTPGTLYFYRAYATNSMGTVYDETVYSFVTEQTWWCGAFINVNHEEGDVAPVTKTASYRTVSGIPGEPLKCWIMSNLGADQQAITKDDATEASAGWYWQFNRKQGYKHTGSARTPNSAWINSINEDLDWQPANDPCAIELGIGWRIPTYSEWNNVDGGGGGGGWTNWDGPWNSALGMHAGGLLLNTDGSLYNRGSSGAFWSGTRYNGTDGWFLGFNSTGCNVSNGTKAYGFSLRCLSDLMPTVITASVTDITITTATGGGNITLEGGVPVTGRGVCWSTSSNPTISDNYTTDGSGTGVFVSSLTGLSASTLYYVRAYATGDLGTAYGNEVSFTTLAWTCGTSNIINHVAGDVAPVTKTVTYGTVTGIPGESSKCWITSNLGASQQATAKNDATEESAGWYWKFNRKQGYKNDGSTVTPAWTWTEIEEDLDWLAANDPCALELGTGWRIPTLTEWNNIDASGGWTNWNGPWNSDLKLHAAGFLDFFDGSLFIGSRGEWGYYWSSTQFEGGGYHLMFSMGICYMLNDGKTYGSSLRCLKDAPANEVPTVTTVGISDINTTTATGGGDVTFDGGPSVTARGLCWSTSPNPTIAGNNNNNGTGTGAFVSSLAGLMPGTLYYVRAYATNSVGTGYGNEESFTTLAWTCGTSNSISHVAGNIAPVTKTVTYGTVTSIPGESSKCWITSNLGADHQASSVSDNTEASAGWYWQFNRKQGYKYEGSTRTPNDAWITSIDENYEWQTANDPCGLLLGTGWRIPTSTEWSNVDGTGSWTTWTDAWGSALKMHAAGFFAHDGSFNARGSTGCYWSATQISNTQASNLYFYNGASALGPEHKADGYTLRCLKDWLPKLTTASVTNIAQTTATSGGNVISEGGSSVTARGVCWSIAPGPSIFDNFTIDGSGTGAFASSITGLSASTTYYVRAYATNSAGTSYGNEVSFTTLWACGSSITISHVTGTVAPVTKTVIYGTVTGIPGESSKCWITSNLGADHQATAVDDATEESAGWYWQFNRMQGFKHDGTTRTPDNTWITSINENSDWIAGNDPCAIELGSGWRLPTSTEWANVDVSGVWTNWNGPWNSALKMHAAGYLNASIGSLSVRGSNGIYWSSSSYPINNSNGWYLQFYSTDCFIFFSNKANGFSSRCIKN
jgi:hypothetical protein